MQRLCYVVLGDDASKERSNRMTEGFMKAKVLLVIPLPLSPRSPNGKV